jgi:hypothetical protein
MDKVGKTDKRVKGCDWESVERSFRAGVLSLREIGRLNDVSEAMIRKRAKSAGWERDLTKRVNEKVRIDMVRNVVRTDSLQTEREIIESAAAQVVHVVRSHRKAIGSGIALTDLLMKQLTDVAGKRDEFEAEIEVLTAEDKSPERCNRLMKAVSLGAHSTIVVNLANAAKTWITLERQSFNMQDEPETPPDPQKAASDDGLDQALAELAAKAGYRITAG